MVKVDIIGRIIDYKPYQDGLYRRRMMMKILANRSFLRVFRPGDNITNEFIQTLRDVIDPNHHFEQNIVLAMHGLSGSGKSAVMMSLIKEVIPDRFSHENFCFTDKQILEQAENLPKNSFVVRDEGTAKAIYGEGSMRTANQLQLLVETCRKYGLNIGLVEPGFVKYDVAKYYLETVDMDLGNRITRVAIREPETLQYLGAIYVPVLPESDPDWIAYNVRKDEFIENMMQGRIADAKLDYEKLVTELVRDCDTEMYKNKGERLSFVKQKFPHFTLGEIKTISALFEVQLRRNQYLGRFDNEHTEGLRNQDA